MSQINLNLDSLNPTNFKKTVRHKIQDGENILRLLPPFGAEANGSPYAKWGVIWGLTDPNTGRSRPYASSSTYEGACPVYDYLDLLRPRVEQLKLELTGQGLSEDEIKERLKPFNEFISDIRPKTVFSYNAVNKSGQIGVVDLKSTAHKKVLKLMRDYINDYSQDPTSLNAEMNDSGVWFNITRAGEGFNTTYDAFKSQLKVKDPNTGALTYQDDRSALPDNIVNNYDELAYDLNSLYQKLSYNDLKDVLVANVKSFAQENNTDLVLFDGFGLGEDLPQSGTLDAGNAPSSPTPNINLNLGPVEDETPVQVPTGTPVETTTTNTPPTNAANATNEELIKLADSIFDTP